MAYDFYKGEILLIDKPYTWSSFQAVNKIKHSIKNHTSWIQEGQKIKAKVGHAGTLDPLATGLLIVATGKKTKTLNELMGMEKEYTGTFFIGATTSCFDKEKEVDAIYPSGHITEELLHKTARQFIGKQLQVPPLFSAVMVDGKRAYELAREGSHAELKSREIEIKEFEITGITLPDVSFRVVCSKGTYIRSLARDFGRALQSGAYLTSLRRTRIGNFEVKDAQDPNAFAAEFKLA